MDWLKQIFENATDEQIESFKKAIPMHFVPKDQYNKKVDELKLKTEEYGSLESQLGNSETLMKELKKKAELSDEYKTKLDNQMSQMEQFKADADKRVQVMQKTSALEKKLLTKFAPDVIDLVLKDFDLEKIELADDGDVKDFDSIVAPITEKRKSLVLTETANTPPPSDKNTPPATDLDNLRKAMGVS